MQSHHHFTAPQSAHDRDKDHITVTKQFLWKRPEREREYVGIGYFTHTLIAHTYLELNADTVLEG